MKIGIKLWSSNPSKYIESAGFADFVEVLPVDEKSVARFAKHKHNYTVHVPHEYFGYYPAMHYEKTPNPLHKL